MASGPLPPPPGHRTDESSPPAAIRRSPQRVPDRSEPWPLPPAPGSPPAPSGSGGGPGGAPPTAQGGAGWSQPGGGQWSPQAPKRTDGVAVAALVVGILGLVASLIPFGLVIGVPMGIAAIVMGIIGIRRRIQRGLAIGGLVTGILSLLVAVAYIGLFVFVADSGPGVLEGIVDEAIEESSDVSATSSCDAAEAEPVTVASVDTPPDVEVHTVEACPDSFDDIEWAVELENAGGAPLTLDVEATGVDGGTGEPNSVTASLEPGERGWVDITTFDEWRTPLSVDLEIDES